MRAIDTFNRTLLFVIGMAVAAAAAICLLVATSAVGSETLAPSEWFRTQFRDLAGLDKNNEVIAVAVCSVALALGLLVALLQLAPRGSPRRQTLNLIDANGNSVVTSPESVTQIVEQAASDVPGVIRTTAGVRQGPDGVLVEAAAVLQPDVNVVEKSNELNDRIRTEVQDRLAMKLAGLRLELRLADKSGVEQARRRGPAKLGERREKISSH